MGQMIKIINGQLMKHNRIIRFRATDLTSISIIKTLRHCQHMWVSGYSVIIIICQIRLSYLEVVPQNSLAILVNHGTC